jgi:hypothetical protein
MAYARPGVPDFSRRSDGFEHLEPSSSARRSVDEHHLFPNMTPVNIAKSRRIVREHCQTPVVTSTETSIPRTYAGVISYLNRVGRLARDP